VTFVSKLTKVLHRFIRRTR